MKFFKVISAGLFLLATGLAFSAQPPNILFIFIDDSGWGDLSCYGNPVKTKGGDPITPNLDRLASQGIRFTQGYVASPICSPSRTGVLSGIEPARYAIYSFLNDRAANATRNMADWVQSDTVSAPRLFQQAGYRTGQFGKWHMGNGRDVNNAPPPAEYGFDESLVAFEGNGNRLLYYNDDGTKYGLSKQNEDATVGTYEYVYFYEAAGRHTDAALRFITNAVQAGKPFYVHVPYNDTHSPYNVPPGQENDFDHITSDTTGKLFLGELHNLDRQIGRLVEGIDGLGAASKTLVVVVGDNGAPKDALETLLNRNGGLRGGKGNLYEGGVREAFIIRWPGTVPSGVVNSNTVVSTLDLLPTYAAFAGIPLPRAPFAGEDMSDVFRGATRPRVKPLYWEYGTVSGLAPASPKLALRSGEFKFMRDPDGSRRELYRVPQDHAESANLVNHPEYAAVVAELEPKLLTWYEEAVLGNVGPAYPCGLHFTGLVIGDNYGVTGGNSPGAGFGANNGGNYQIASRLAGAAGGEVTGYRLGATGGSSPRTAGDFSISTNRLAAASRDGNGRFEFSVDGSQPVDFGPYLAGRHYEFTVQMTISKVGAAYAQRMSLSLADASNLAVGDVNLGVQIGTDGAGALGVFKRVAAGANSGGGAVNTKILGGLPIGAPVTLTARIVDANANVADFASTYEILVGGSPVSAGTFRFNRSTANRYLIFDVAAHEGPVYYDNLQLVVTDAGNSTTFCHLPVLGLSDLTSDLAGLGVRLYWTAQPGLTVYPEWTSDLASAWRPVTNGTGAPLSVTTPHGSIQWLRMSSPSAVDQPSFFRLRKKN